MAKGNQKDNLNAAQRIYGLGGIVQDGYTDKRHNTPKIPFSFVVHFELTESAKQLLRDMYGYDLNIGQMSAQVILRSDKPTFNMETFEINQYNRKRIAQGKISYNPISMTFYDTVDSSILMLIDAYRAYYYGDFSDKSLKSWTYDTVSTPSAFEQTYPILPNTNGNPSAEADSAAAALAEAEAAEQAALTAESNALAAASRAADAAGSARSQAQADEARAQATAARTRAAAAKERYRVAKMQAAQNARAERFANYSWGRSLTNMGDTDQSYFFKRIDIYEIDGNTYTVHNIHHPVIEGISTTAKDHASDDPATYDLTLRYEGITNICPITEQKAISGYVSDIAAKLAADGGEYSLSNFYRYWGEMDEGEVNTNDNYDPRQIKGFPNPSDGGEFSTLGALGAGTAIAGGVLGAINGVDALLDGDIVGGAQNIVSSVGEGFAGQVGGAVGGAASAIKGIGGLF